VILLDTHVLVFLALRPERLSKPATRAIAKADRRDGVAISSITLWELAQLVDQGRVAVPGSVEGFLKDVCRRPRLTVLDITPEIAALTVMFPQTFPKDPADRIIGATARAHGLPLVTKDGNMRESALLRTIW
jgi:PIN domain nuclease of toxin-antitoxin system